MALTRAQLLMGNSAQGTILSGEVQGVKQGAGISISSDGTISIDSQTISGLMKLGQTSAEANAAYNSYDWPNATGTQGQQLTITNIGGGVTTLGWGDAAGIGWTGKGQLIVGTGTNTSTFLNVGANNSFLIADSTTASGLNYTSTVLRTTAAPTTGAAIMPASTTANRPATPANGYTRFNTNTSKLEVFGATTWETVASTSSAGGFVPQTGATGSAVLPVGTTGQRDGSPVAGYTRFNTSIGDLEFYTGSQWSAVGSSLTGSFVSQSVPASGTPSAIIPSGTTAQRQAAPAAGYLRWNSTNSELEVYNGGAWGQIGGGGTTLTAGLGIDITGTAIRVAIPEATSAPTVGSGANQATIGSMYWDTNEGALYIYYTNGGNGTWVQTTPSGNGIVAATNAQALAGTSTTVYSSPATAVGKNSNTGAARLPSGTTAQRPTAPFGGDTRFNTSTGTLEVYDGSAWGEPGYSPILPGSTAVPGTLLGSIWYSSGAPTQNRSTGIITGVTNVTPSQLEIAFTGTISGSDGQLYALFTPLLVYGGGASGGSNDYSFQFNFSGGSVTNALTNLRVNKTSTTTAWLFYYELYQALGT